uniref:Hypotheticial protein n=1 Tax=Schistosoma japonicum TaxID=6182 RepID=C1LD61_SCHJA|nr:hypotheticial protein [Schistosoma japonicum]
MLVLSERATELLQELIIGNQRLIELMLEQTRIQISSTSLPSVNDALPQPISEIGSQTQSPCETEVILPTAPSITSPVKQDEVLENSAHVNPNVESLELQNSRSDRCARIRTIRRSEKISTRSLQKPSNCPTKPQHPTRNVKPKKIGSTPKVHFESRNIPGLMTSHAKEDAVLLRLQRKDPTLFRGGGD